MDRLQRERSRDHPAAALRLAHGDDALSDEPDSRAELCQVSATAEPRTGTATAGAGRPEVQAAGWGGRGGTDRGRAAGRGAVGYRGSARLRDRAGTRSDPR